MPQVKLHIILQNPPAGIDYCLQKGAGSKYETEQVQRSAGADLHFYLVADVKESKMENGSPVLKSPFIQRSSPHDFIYIDIGTFAGQPEPAPARRLKIPIMGITRTMIDELHADIFLETSVPGTGKDGGPNCATVKPFAGWHAIKGK